MSAPHDPFIKLNKLRLVPGQHQSSPLFLRPEGIKEIENGKVHVDGGFHEVSEKAEQIRDLVIAKLAENAKAERLGV